MFFMIALEMSDYYAIISQILPRDFLLKVDALKL